MVNYRTERDFLGRVKVPSDAYYGSETERAKELFQISGVRVRSEFIKAYAIVKRSAAIANMKVGKLDRRRGTVIVRACDEIIGGKLNEQFVLDVFQAGAGTNTNMNVNEVVANRAIEILGGKKGDYRVVHPNDHVNMSQSTNDTYPTTMHIATYIAITRALAPALESLVRALRSKAKEFARIPKIGRTHLQDAVPMFLGDEFSGYEATVAKQAEHVKRSASALLSLSIGGTAVGTGIEASKAYSKAVITEINRYTGANFRLARNFFELQQNRNEEEWVGSALKDLAIALNKIASDLRLLASGPVAGFSDVMLPAVMPGSSIMPGKVNPSVPEMLNMVCFEVIGKTTSIEHATESGQLELNVYMPLISQDLLYSIGILSNAVSVFTAKCIKGIRANKEKLSENLERDISIATALAPYIGYAKASEIARQARKEGKTVKEVALERKLMPEKELSRILDPRNMIREKRSHL
ncbi:MAG: aspartate ammonia-lyase [Candidatus Micrarchaeales archaeon]|nr:aspartate ammonia-lyase [Candidatus Micrarchaeales archaeon]